MKRLLPLPILLAACLAGCAGSEPRVPRGLEVVREEVPTPPSTAVAEAQRRLAERELYVGPITGNLTPAVRVALARFQRLEDLPVTGLLDEATLQALDMGPLASWPDEPEGEAAEEEPTGPTAAEILEMEEIPVLPQPPPGALAEARAAAAAILARESADAGSGVAEARRLLPPEDSFADGPAPGADVRAADEGPADEGATEAPGGDLPAAQAAAARAQGALATGRAEAFALLLDARREGGWALLPAPLLAALEEALQRRSLLLRGADGRLGPDDEAAIRWVQHSNGLEPTGLPSLALFEALGIDPGPMFAAPPAGE